jgi:hypothetical protein
MLLLPVLSLGVGRNTTTGFTCQKLTASHLSYISPNCNPRRRPITVETCSQSLWTPACFSSVTHMQCNRQRRLRQKPFIRFNGCLKGDCCLLHQPCRCYWYCRRCRDIFQERSSSIHGYMDIDDHSRCSCITFHLWLCGISSELPMDLLDSGNRKARIPPFSESSELTTSFSDQRSSAHSIRVSRA